MTKSPLPFGAIFSEGAIYKYWYNFTSFVSSAFVYSCVEFLRSRSTRPLGQFLVLALFLNIEIIFSILEMALLYIHVYKPLHNIKMWGGVPTPPLLIQLISTQITYTNPQTLTYNQE